MTQTSTKCPSTTAVTDAEAVEILTAAGIADATEVYRRWWGRKMCAEPTCRGAVLRTTKGLRKHVIGSNLTDAERTALTGTGA